MLTTQFCPVCGAANETTRSSCFACGQILSALSAQSLTGTGLPESYKIQKVLGSGGFSSVFLAHDEQASRLVAIKQIKLGGLSTEEVIDATSTFNRERDLLEMLNHPQIPHLYAYLQDREHWYLVLEYLDGPTLETYLETRKARQKPLSLLETLTMALQLCKVLEYLHTRQPAIIFRDLKPGNIIRNPGGKLSLIDFGIARRFQPGQARDTQRLGSPGYAAPEQYGKAQTTPQSDIYSLGVLIYALLSNTDPSQDEPDLTKLRQTGSPGDQELHKLLRHMLAVNPAVRPTSVRQVADTLEWIKRHEELSQQSGRIWTPPALAPTPPPVVVPNTGRQQQQHIHIQQPPASAAQPQTGQAPPRRPTRRTVLAGLGVAGVATIIGGYTFVNYIHPNKEAITYGQIVKGNLVYAGHNDTVTSVAWASDSKRVASFSADNTVRIWRTDNGADISTYEASLEGNGVCWLANSDFVISAYRGSLVQVRNADTAYISVTYNSGNTVSAVACAGQVAVGTNSGEIDIVDPLTGSSLIHYHEHKVGITSIAWSPNMQTIASASEEGVAQVWNSVDGTTLFAHEFQNRINAITWDRMGEYLASAGDGNSVQVWSALTGELLATYQGHTGNIKALTWAPDQRLLASASDDSTVHIWNPFQSSSQPMIYTGHSASVESLAWSPDGQWIASGSADTTVHIWPPDPKNNVDLH